jgi:hypothetical protein
MSYYTAKTKKDINLNFNDKVLFLSKKKRRLRRHKATSTKSIGPKTKIDVFARMKVYILIMTLVDVFFKFQKNIFAFISQQN